MSAERWGSDPESRVERKWVTQDLDSRALGHNKSWTARNAGSIRPSCLRVSVRDSAVPKIDLLLLHKTSSEGFVAE